MQKRKFKILGSALALALTAGVLAPTKAEAMPKIQKDGLKPVEAGEVQPELSDDQITNKDYTVDTSLPDKIDLVDEDKIPEIPDIIPETDAEKNPKAESEDVIPETDAEMNPKADPKTPDKDPEAPKELEDEDYIRVSDKDPKAPEDPEAEKIERFKKKFGGRTLTPVDPSEPQPELSDEQITNRDYTADSDKDVTPEEPKDVTPEKPEVDKPVEPEKPTPDKPEVEKPKVETPEEPEVPDSEGEDAQKHGGLEDPGKPEDEEKPKVEEPTPENPEVKTPEKPQEVTPTKVEESSPKVISTVSTPSAPAAPKSTVRAQTGGGVGFGIAGLLSSLVGAFTARKKRD